MYHFKITKNEVIILEEKEDKGSIEENISYIKILGKKKIEEYLPSNLSFYKENKETLIFSDMPEIEALSVLYDLDEILEFMGMDYYNQYNVCLREDDCFYIAFTLEEDNDVYKFLVRVDIEKQI